MAQSPGLDLSRLAGLVESPREAPAAPCRTQEWTGNIWKVRHDRESGLSPSLSFLIALSLSLSLSRSRSLSRSLSRPGRQSGTGTKGATSHHLPIDQGSPLRNEKRFRGGLVFKAHRSLYHSTLRSHGVMQAWGRRAAFTPTLTLTLTIRSAVRDGHRGGDERRVVIIAPADAQVTEMRSGSEKGSYFRLTDC